MKLFLTSVAVYLALCDASADSELRKRHSRPSGGGEPGGRLANMIKTECNGDFSCEGVDLNNLDCTFDFERPDERPDFSSLNSDEQAQLKAELQAKREERHQNLLQCACCAGMSVEDILAAREEQDGYRLLGPRGMSGGSGGSGRPGMGMASGSRPEGGGLGSRIQEMVETECNGDFSCEGVDLDNLDCTFDFERPDERPDFSSLNSDEQAQLKAELQAKREVRRQNMLQCTCCAGMSVEDILAARGDIDGSRPLGGRPGGRPGDMRGDGSSGGSGRPGMGMAGSSRPQQGSGGGSGRPSMGLFSEGSRPQGGGDGVSGRPDDMDVEAMLAEKCDDFLPKCDSLTDQNIDCSIVDSVSSKTRGGRRRDFLYCGCCVGGGD